MESSWLSLLLQVPLVGIFVVFVLYTERGRQAAVLRNHEEWRTWLNQQQAEAQRREGERQAALMEHLDDWRKWSDQRDMRQREQHLEFMTAMVKTEQQLAYLTNITLLVYSSVNKMPLPEELTRLLKR